MGVGVVWTSIKLQSGQGEFGDCWAKWDNFCLLLTTQLPKIRNLEKILICP